MEELDKSAVDHKNELAILRSELGKGTRKIRRRAMGLSTVGSFDAVCRARRTRKASSSAAALVIFTAVEASHRKASSDSMAP